MSDEAPMVRFTVEKTPIRPGECVKIHWRVDRVQAVYFFQAGEPWQEHGVVGEGEQEVCPSQTTEYRLRVIKRDGTAEVHKIVIQVAAPADVAPVFSVDRTVIGPGECATFRWHVEGVKAVYFFVAGEPWQQHGVVGAGEQQVCPAQTTEYRLRVIKRDDSAEVHRITVEVRAEAQPAQMFSVDRSAIRPGECATFRWHVEGVKAVYFFPEGERWEDHGVVGEGQQQVCPPRTTTYCLRVVKADDAVEVHYLGLEVRP